MTIISENSRLFDIQYRQPLVRQLILARLDGRRTVDAMVLYRKLRITCKRPTIARAIVDLALASLPNREFLPAVRIEGR